MPLIKSPDLLPESFTVIEGKERFLGQYLEISPHQLPHEWRDFRFSFVGLQAGQTLDAHVHQVESYLWIAKGEGESCGDKPFHFSEGDLIFIPSKAFHGFKTSQGFCGIAFQNSEKELFGSELSTSFKAEESDAHLSPVKLNQYRSNAQFSVQWVSSKDLIAENSNLPLPLILFLSGTLDFYVIGSREELLKVIATSAPANAPLVLVWKNQ